MSLAYLDNGLAANEMGTAADGNTTARAIHNVFNAFNQSRHVAKPRCAIGISKQGILAAHMTKAMGDTAALAPVLSQRHNPQDIMQAILLRKVQNHIDRLVATPVIDNDNLIAAETKLLWIGSARRMPLLCRHSRVLGAGAASKVLVQILHGLLQRGDDTILFVVRGKDDAEEKLGGLDGTNIRSWVCLVRANSLLVDTALCKPSVVPAGERARGRLARGAAGDVCLFRGEDGARLRGDEVQEKEELRIIG